jgi:hypothetical protein
MFIISFLSLGRSADVPGFTKRVFPAGTCTSLSVKGVGLFPFFRVDADRDLSRDELSLQVPSTTNVSLRFAVRSNRFYSIDAALPRVDFCAGHSPVTATFLFLGHNLCWNASMVITARTYFHGSRVFNATEAACYIFWEPGSTYRVTFDCIAWPPAVCAVASSGVIDNEGQPVFCRSNSTCDVTLLDGFVISVEPWAHEQLLNNNTLDIYLVKGPENVWSQDCCWYPVAHVTAWGITGGGEMQCEFDCSPPEQPIVIAIIMVAILILALVLAVVVFKLCRPNHEAYLSDEADRRKGKRRNSTDELLPTTSSASTSLMMSFGETS